MHTVSYRLKIAKNDMRLVWIGDRNVVLPEQDITVVRFWSTLSGVCQGYEKSLHSS